MPAINVWAVALAAASTIAIGALFYLPSLFGRRWLALLDGPAVKELPQGAQDLTPDDEATRGIGWVYPLLVMAGAITAVVLAAGVSYVHKAGGGSYFLTALGVGLALWAGFTATRLLTHGLFDTRSLQLPVLTALQELASVVCMSTIIGLWPPAGL